MRAIERFAARLDVDESLRARLKGVRGASRADVVRGIAEVAGGAGIELSIDELEGAFGGSSRASELGLDELGKISGGGFTFSPEFQARMRAALDERVRAVFERR